MTYRAAGVQREITAIHGDDRSCDPCGCVRSQEDGESPDVVGMAKAACGDPAQELIAEAGRCGNTFFQPGIENLRRQNRIYTNAARRPFRA